MKKILKRKSVKLPNNISPVKYELTIKPDLESFVFEGKEIIKVKISKKTKEIILHSKDIKISTAEIIQNKKSQFADIKYDEKTETVKFSFKNEISKGKADLIVVFEGIINDNLRGFYKSTYTLNGEKKNLATTQFEATDARRAFPCFDEPAQKAIFDVSLIIPGEKTAISNTLPLSIKEHEGGYKIVKFSPTPVMSTYLLAFIIGDFEYIEGWTKNKKVRVRVFTTNGKKHQARFALKVAIKSLEFYNKYFDIPYPLNTLDLIAIPDFESAAMENWGAVTFRETAILVDEEHTSLSNKQWISIVIAHEIAHQWFGNLVTMHWWTDLWLNEGFASYMENLCVDYMFPDWHIWDLYLADRYQVALRLDSLANSHPIEVEVHHPSEISEIFDMVSYAKGSAVIRMVAEYIGYEKFRDGLRYYLKKHSYKNTHTKDLWEAFERVSGKPIKKMMQNWTQKTGYPIISLLKKGENFEIRQDRFLSSRISAKKTVGKTIWQVPIRYENNNSNSSILLTKKSLKIKSNYIGKLNIGEGSKGYRVIRHAAWRRTGY
jgi:puromycin-sensitive aminopeptidase